MNYVSVAIGLPKGPFTYAVKDTDALRIRKGVRVLVPFRSSERIGYIVDHAQKPLYDTKYVKAIIDDHPIFSETLLAVTHWLSDYYQCSWGEALDNALPALIRQGRMLSYTRNETEEYQNPIFQHTLTDDQVSVFQAVSPHLRGAQYAGFVLQGVTGSGKSEVYVRLINDVLAAGKSVICLVPEIALTVHLREYFASYFSAHLEVLHSKMTPVERYKAWQRIYQRQGSLVLGPRSALFSPVKDLGLIVMDEEHENSYKQEDTPRYHARDVAEQLAKESQAVFLMGTATPSLEARSRCDTGRYSLLRLDTRIVQEALPEVRVINLKNEMTKGGNFLVSRPLRRAIEDTLSRGDHTVLFINRRGYATFVLCTSCGEVLSCKSCQVSLTYHAQKKKLLCHYCNYSCDLPHQCPECGGTELKYGGIGTERVESQVRQFFPTARVERLDTDRVRKRGEAEKIIRNFTNGGIDILIGTQMLAKGFDFPNVTLVGIINADGMLSLPDFRASERSFQLITQVAGRTGRGDKGGSVILQTFMPENYAIKFARYHDYDGFYEYEKRYRQQLQYPPYTYLVNIILRSKNERQVERSACALHEKLSALCFEKPVDLIGPAPLPFYKLRNYYRWHVMLRSAEQLLLHRCAEEARALFARSRSVYIAIDVDPVSIV